jgi:acetyl esterase/lipase
VRTNLLARQRVVVIDALGQALTRSAEVTMRTFTQLGTVVTIACGAAFLGCTRPSVPSSASPAVATAAAPTPAPTLMTPADLVVDPYPAPDHRITYGTDSSQYGELRLPSGRGPHPVAILIHGGCFKAAYATVKDLGGMAEALERDGVATWNVEYRRLGQAGGGWPGTYVDVGRAVDHLRTLAPQYDLDLKRVIVVGHSAGGHLAMWTAVRHRLPTASPLYVADPLPLRGVINLAGPIHVSKNIPGYESLCRDSVITTLLGGTPAAVPDRYAQASAISVLPLGIPQVIVVGSHEEFVPLPLVRDYEQAATRAGDSIRVILIPGAGHFEIATPKAFTWPRVHAAMRSLLEGRLPPS